MDVRSGATRRREVARLDGFEITVPPHAPIASGADVSKSSTSRRRCGGRMS
jgi:hypothetical protein